MTLRRHGRDLSEGQALFFLYHALFDEVGQEYQHEENGSDEHEGCKETKVTQGWCIEWHQTGKGTHCGDVTNE